MRRVCVCVETSVSALSGEDDGLSQSGEGKREDGRRSASPTDPVHSLSAFTRKTGAFVNKPSTQVRLSLILYSITAVMVAVWFLLHARYTLCPDNHSQPGPALLCVCFSGPGLRGERSYGS